MFHALMVKQISSLELIKLLDSDPSGVELIDVREEDEYKEAHIKNSKLIPMNSVMGQLSDIDFTKQVVLYCRTGVRSMYVATIMGPEREVYNLEGGIVDFFRSGGEKHIEN